jgi:predicted Zn finger-like uncharacterized protein
MFVRNQKMSAVTQCPACSTRFKISQEQLEAHHGLVRCGRCRTVFNAIEHLSDNEPSPQLDLPIMLEEAPSEEPAAKNETSEAETATAARTEPSESADTFEELREQAAYEPEEAQPAEEEEFLAAVPKKKRPGWPWVVASSILLLILLAQAMYFFRVGLAARLPGLKPMLVGYCGLLGCQVTMPQDADLMSIDSSDLEADPDHANVITLTATLRNHASYAQAYPNLELTLNDINDKPVARRTFRPAEYLQKGEDQKLGLAGRRELDVRLSLDTTDLKPSGYRLLLFYPK